MYEKKNRVLVMLIFTVSNRSGAQRHVTKYTVINGTKVTQGITNLQMDNGQRNATLLR